MCIHHLKYHTPCGHTTQSSAQILYCDPVAKALEYYHNQPKEFNKGRLGRAITLNPMKNPEVCGSSYVRSLRNIVYVGGGHGITPEGWQYWMTKRVQQHLQKGEDARSVITLLEEECPALTDQVSEDWIHHLRSCFQNHAVRWRSPEDLQNEHVGGDIVTGVDGMGCGHFVSGNPRCFTKWLNPFGGGPAFCPWKWSQDTGEEIPRRPDRTPEEFFTDAQMKTDHENNPDEFKKNFNTELLHQARDHADFMSGDTRHQPTTQYQDQLQALLSLHEGFGATSRVEAHLGANTQENGCMVPSGENSGVAEQQLQSPPTSTLKTEDDCRAEDTHSDEDDDMYFSTPDLRACMISDTKSHEDTPEPRWMSGVGSTHAYPWCRQSEECMK
ncbi:MAG: hypothetical protein LQ350_008483 [Teloschistes chrysophthalmus]|nr:MAG: hypothetical protein LQ350_008483 [Niorma chrysophthalma]